MWYFLDTSTFLKHYKPEVGSEVVSALIDDAANTIALSVMTIAESLSVFNRLHRAGHVTAEQLQRVVDGMTVDYQTGRYHVLDMTHRQLSQTQGLIFDHNLRAPDALILATALSLADETPVFVCADTRSGLLHAAEAHGLTTLNPLSPHEPPRS